MGSSVAYHLIKSQPDLRIAVVERDPSYTHASAMLSAGGMRQQFSLPANIELSLYGIDFLKKAPGILRVEGEDTESPDMQFKEQGYLFLSTPKGEPILRRNHKTQHEHGASWLTLLDSAGLKTRFPWLTCDGISLGCYGEQNEGWFDPWSLLSALRAKSSSLGVTYLHGTVQDMVTSSTSHHQGVRAIEEVLVSESNGERDIRLSAGTVVCAAGAWAAEVVAMCGDGVTPLPVRPRKRCIFSFHCADSNAPSALDTPLTVLPETGVYFRPEGAPGHFLCGVSPPADRDRDATVEDLETADHELFEDIIWPSLYDRVPAFGNIKVTSSWAGFYEYNTVDQNAIIGYHPEIQNLVLVNGFSGHGLQQSPGAGRAVAELIMTGEFESVDVSCFGMDRFGANRPIFEDNIV